MQVKKHWLETHMEELTGSKLEKEYDKAYCHLGYLTWMQSTLYTTPGWRKHKLESRLLGETLTASDREMIPLSTKKIDKLRFVR